MKKVLVTLVNAQGQLVVHQINLEGKPSMSLALPAGHRVVRVQCAPVGANASDPSAAAEPADLPFGEHQGQLVFAQDEKSLHEAMGDGETLTAASSAMGWGEPLMVHDTLLADGAEAAKPTAEAEAAKGSAPAGGAEAASTTGVAEAGGLLAGFNPAYLGLLALGGGGGGGGGTVSTVVTTVPEGNSGGGTGSGGGTETATATATASGKVVLSSVTGGLTVRAFNPTTKQQIGVDAEVATDGSYTLKLGNYSGPVVLVLVDANAEISNFVDESDKTNKDLDRNILAVGQVKVGEVTTLHMNHLTTLAAHQAGVTASGGQNGAPSLSVSQGSDPTQFTATNQKVAHQLGLSGDISKLDVEPVFNADLTPSDPSSLNPASKMEAIVSGKLALSVSSGKTSIHQALESLAKGLDSANGIDFGDPEWFNSSLMVFNKLGFPNGTENGLISFLNELAGQSSSTTDNITFAIHAVSQDDVITKVGETSTSEFLIRGTGAPNTTYTVLIQCSNPSYSETVEVTTDPDGAWDKVIQLTEGMSDGVYQIQLKSGDDIQAMRQIVVNLQNDDAKLSVQAITLTDTESADVFSNQVGHVQVIDVDSNEGRSFAVEYAEDASKTGYDKQVKGVFGNLYFNSVTGAYYYDPDDALINGLKSNSTNLTDSFKFTVTFDKGDGVSTQNEITLSVNVNGADDLASLTLDAGAELEVVDTELKETNDDVESMFLRQGKLVWQDADDNQPESGGFLLKGSTSSTTVTLNEVEYDAQIEGAYGTLYVHSSTGAYAYQPNAEKVNAAKAQASDAFIIQAGEQGKEFTLSVTIRGVDDLPVVSVSSASFTITDTQDYDSFADQNYIGLATAKDADSSTNDIQFGLENGVAEEWESVEGVAYQLRADGDFGSLWLNTTTGQYRFVANDDAINRAISESVEDFVITFAGGSQKVSITVEGADDQGSFDLSSFNDNGDIELSITDTEGYDQFDSPNSLPNAVKGRLTLHDRDDATAIEFQLQRKVGTDIQLGNTANFTLDGIAYDHSIEGEFGTLYLQSSTGVYVYVPGLMDENGAINYDRFNGIRENTRESFEIVAGYRDQNDDWQEMNVDGGASRTISVNITAGDDKALISAVAMEVQDTPEDDANNSALIKVGQLEVLSLESENLAYGIQDGDSGEYTVGTQSYQVKKESQWGALYVNSETGSYLYIPNAEKLDQLSSGESEKDSFTVSVGSSTGQIDSLASLVVTLVGGDDATVLISPDPLKHEVKDTIAVDAFDPVTGRIEAKDVDSILTYHLEGTGVTTESIESVLWETISSAYGSLRVNTTTGDYNYRPNATAVNALAEGVSKIDAFKVKVGGKVQTIEFNLTGADDAPVASLAQSELTFTEMTGQDDNPAVTQTVSFAALGVILSDVDGSLIDAVQLTFKAPTQDDRLRIQVANGWMDLSGASGTFQFQGNTFSYENTFNTTSKEASLTLKAGSALNSGVYQSLVHALGFNNTSNMPVTTSRQFELVAMSGEHRTKPVLFSIKVQETDDAIQIAPESLYGSTGLLRVLGSGKGGEPLTVDTSGISDPDLSSSAALQFEYQWQFKATTNGATWADINGATGNSYLIPTSVTSGYYRAVVKVRDGLTGHQATELITMQRQKGFQASLAIALSTSSLTVTEKGQENPSAGETVEVQLFLQDGEDRPAVISKTLMGLSGWTLTNDGLTLSRDTEYGSVSLEMNTQRLSYTLDNSKPKTNALKEGQQITESFEIHANLENDANFKASRSVSFTIKGSNDAPELTVDESFKQQLVEDVTTTASEVSFAVVDLDGGGTPPSVDATGWTKVVASNGGVTYTQQGTYGKATLNLGTGKLSYQLSHVLPAIQQLSEGQEVQDAFTIKWVDGSGASVEKKVSFDIKGTNDAPELKVGLVTGELKEDTSNATTATVDVTVTDTDANDTVKFVPGGGWATETVNGVQVHSRSGTYGKVTLNPQTGRLTYQLDNSLDATQGLAEGETVKESVVLEFEDGEGERTQIQTVEFTVTGTNEAPTIALSSEPAELIEDVSDHQIAKLTLISVDPDDSTPPTYRLTEDMGWYSTELGGVSYHIKYTDYGTLQLNTSTHELTYTLSEGDPDLEDLKEGQTITDEHVITVVDSQGGVFSLTVGFKITGSNEAPEVTMGEVQGRLIEDDSENQSAWVQLRASDPDGEIASFTLDERQGHYGTATLDSATGKLTYTLDQNLQALNALKAGHIYVETFKVTAKDEMGLSTSKEVTFYVEGSGDAPVINLTPSTPLQLTEDAATSSVELTLTVADPEEGATPPFILDGPWTSNDQETFTQKSAYGDATFIKSTGQFTYTIDRESSQFLRKDQVEKDSFVVRVKDADGVESTQTIEVTVVGVNEVPTLSISTPDELTEAGFDAVGINEATATLTLFDPDDPYYPEDPEAGVNPVSVDTSANRWTTTDGVTFQQGRYGRIELDSGGTSIRYVLDQTLSNGLAINATANDEFEITVKDAQGGIKAETVTFIIHGANDAPTVTVSNTVATLIEAAVDTQDVASAVAELSLSDVDSQLFNYDFDHMQSPQGGWEEGDSSGTTVWRKRGTYGTVELNPWTHKATYTLDNSQLATNRLGETDSVTDPFTLRVKDGAGAHQDLTLEFTIQGSNDAPAVTAGDANASLKEDGDNSQLMATRILTASDPEAGLGLGGGLSQFTFVDPYPTEETGWSTQDGGATYTRTGTYGVATLTIETGELTYHLSNAQDNVQQLKASSTVTDAFKVQIRDEQGKASLTTDVLFTVEGTNDAPVLTSVQVLDGFIDWDWTNLTFDTVLQNAQVSDIDGEVNGFLITSVPAGSSLEIKAAGSAEWVLVGGTPNEPTLFKVGDELRWKPASTTASNQASSEMDLFTIKAVDDQGSPSADGFTVKANVSSRLGSLSAMFTALEAQTDGGSESYILSDGTLYLLNSFTTVGTSAFQAMNGVYEALLVGGGGGGGSNVSAGGGGAGGVLLEKFTLSADDGATEVQVTVGAGGAGGGVGKDLVVPNPGAAAIAVQERGANGGDSVIAYDGEPKYFAYGGGGGGGSSAQSAGTTGLAGGSGGGGSGFSSPGTSAGGLGTSEQGNAGGSGYSASLTGNRGGGGGGGATTAGTSGTRTGNTTTAGNGGDGLTTNFTGIELIYGGGGGGGARTSGIAGQGGQGGGGNGGLNHQSVSGGTNAQNGQDNTGGGGGGAGGTNSPNKGLGGSGGSGVVHVRYDVTPHGEEAILLAQLEEITGLSLASEHLASYFNAIEAAWKDAGQQSTWWTQAKVTEAVRLHGLNMTAQSQPLVEDDANMSEAVRTFSTPLGYAVDSDQLQNSDWTRSDSNELTYNAQGTYGTAVLDLTSGKVTYTLHSDYEATQSLGEGEIGEDVFSVPWKTSNGTLLGNKSVVFRITGASDFDPASLTALGVSFNSEDDVTPAWTHIHASAFLSKMSDDYPNHVFSIQTINSEGLLELETSPDHWEAATVGTLLTMDSQLRWADPDQNINDQSKVSPFEIQVQDATRQPVLSGIKLQLYAVRDTSLEDQVNNLYWVVNDIRETEGGQASQSDFVMGGATGSDLLRSQNIVNLDDYFFISNEDVLLASLKTLTQRDDLQASRLAEYLNSIEDLAVQNNYFASESNWTQDHLKEAINTVMGT